MALFFLAIVFCLLKTISTKLGISLTIGRARMRLVIDFLEKKATAHSEIETNKQNAKLEICFLN